MRTRRRGRMEEFDLGQVCLYGVEDDLMSALFEDEMVGN